MGLGIRDWEGKVREVGKNLETVMSGNLGEKRKLVLIIAFRDLSPDTSIIIILSHRD